MKKLSIQVILQIYTNQGLGNLMEYLDRIEYSANDKFAQEIIDYKKDPIKVESYIKKILTYE